MNPRKQQRARERNLGRSAARELTSLPSTTSTRDLIIAAARTLERQDEERLAAERTARERLGVLVVVGPELRLYRRRDLAPLVGRIETDVALDHALARARSLRVVGHHNTSAPISLATLRCLAAPMLRAA